ncbi:hypothetical protein [Kribbella sp. NPDC048928]|uniref:hypothetical protein n=1 Tax=Kribbella sp. NPDC048928 TaxID=3364111 RepID=UPI003712E2F4
MQTPLRTKRPHPAPAAAEASAAASASAAQYCAFCATEMPFERIEPSDYQIDEPDEWICTKCGSALLIDPPTQDLHHHTA